MATTFSQSKVLSYYYAVRARLNNGATHAEACRGAALEIGKFEKVFFAGLELAPEQALPVPHFEPRAGQSCRDVEKILGLSAGVRASLATSAEIASVGQFGFCRVVK